MCTKQNRFNIWLISIFCLKIVVSPRPNKYVEASAEVGISPGSYPALVFIQPVSSRPKGICIGSLISFNFVLSGKKCLTDLDQPSSHKLFYDIIGGDIYYSNTYKRSKKRVKIKGKLLSVTDKLNFSTDDFALIYLLHRAVISNNFRPIRIKEGTPIENQICTVIGISIEAYKNNEVVPSFNHQKVLVEADIIIVPLKVCNGSNSSTDNVTDVFCGESLEAIDENKETQGCFSGQLICNDQLAGITNCGTNYLEKDFACNYLAIPRNLKFYNEVEETKKFEIKRTLKINTYSDSPILDFTPIYLLSIHLVIVHVLKL